MATDIKNELIDCLKSIDTGKDEVEDEGEGEKEITKTITLLLNSDRSIHNDQADRYAVCHLLGLLFTQSPALMTPANKRVLNKFAKEIKLDEALDNLVKPKTR